MSTNATAIRIVAGIDPGLNSGALICLDRADRDRVLAAVSLVEPRGALKAATQQARELADNHPGAHDIEFHAAVIRARLWIARIHAALCDVSAEHGIPEIFAVESFVDQAQHAKQMLQKRWQTPLLMGMLAGELASFGVTPDSGRLVYQNAGVVLPQQRAETARLADRVSKTLDMVAPGDHQITNDHQRKAFAHVRSLSQRLGAYVPTTTTHQTAA